jgi:hypothetical protein
MSWIDDEATWTPEAHDRAMAMAGRPVVDGPNDDVRVWAAHHRDAVTGNVTLMGSAQIVPMGDHVEVAVYDGTGDPEPGGGFTEPTAADAAARLDRSGYRPWSEPVPHAVAVSERATPGLAAAANQPPQARTSKPAPAPAVGKTLKPGGRRP